MEPISFYGMQTRLDASIPCASLLTTISNDYFSFNIRLSGAIDLLSRHSLRGMYTAGMSVMWRYILCSLECSTFSQC